MAYPVTVLVIGIYVLYLCVFMAYPVTVLVIGMYVLYLCDLWLIR